MSDETSPMAKEVLESESCEDLQNETDIRPVLPPHTKQAAKAIGVLLFFSFLMFTLPFVVFYATKYLLQHYFHMDGYEHTVWSVIAAVFSVNLIIAGYAYVAYHDPEYDDDGNLIHDDGTDARVGIKIREDKQD